MLTIGWLKLEKLFPKLNKCLKPATVSQPFKAYLHHL